MRAGGALRGTRRRLRYWINYPRRAGSSLPQSRKIAATVDNALDPYDITNHTKQDDIAANYS